MAKKKAGKKVPITPKSLIVTFVHYNPNTSWTEAKPIIKRLFESRSFEFDETQAKTDFDNSKFVSDSAAAMKKMVDDLMKDPNVKQAVEQEMARRAAKKAARKKKP